MAVQQSFLPLLQGVGWVEAGRHTERYGVAPVADFVQQPQSRE